MIAPAPKSPLTHRSILAIAVPVMISNVTTPLLGVVDTGVVGRIPDPAYIGAVAIGALVFTFVFWAFSFLRMGYASALAWVLLVIIAIFTAIAFWTSKYWVHYENERG